MVDDLLSVKNLSAFYGSSQVIREISADFEVGNSYGLIGRIGAGKTTTFKAILGLVKSSGTVKFKGEEINNKKSFKRVRMGLGYVPENREIFGELTVSENLKTGEISENPRSLDFVFEMFPRLKERIALKGMNLSGGEQQMLAIARTLMNSPEMVLMDEPFEGLAKPIVEKLYDVFGTLREEERTFLIAGNDFKTLKPIIDNLLIMERGRITFRGTTEEAEETNLDDKY